MFHQLRYKPPVCSIQSAMWDRLSLPRRMSQYASNSLTTCPPAALVISSSRLTLQSWEQEMDQPGLLTRKTGPPFTSTPARHSGSAMRHSTNGLRRPADRHHGHQRWFVYRCSIGSYRSASCVAGPNCAPTTVTVSLAGAPVTGFTLLGGGSKYKSIPIVTFGPPPLAAIAIETVARVATQADS